MDKLTTEFEQLETDLKSYCFRVAYKDSKNKKQELYFWIPCPMIGCCHEITLGKHKKEHALFVTAEKLTRPSGLKTKEFVERAGRPGMCTPEDFGVTVKKYIIPFSRLLEIRIQPSFFHDHLIVWKRNRLGNFIRKEVSEEC